MGTRGWYVETIYERAWDQVKEVIRLQTERFGRPLWVLCEFSQHIDASGNVRGHCLVYTNRDQPDRVELLTESDCNEARAMFLEQTGGRSVP